MVSKDEIRKRHESKIKRNRFQKGKIMERHESIKETKFQKGKKTKNNFLTRKQMDNVDPVKKWDAQGTKGKAILGLMACCLGVVLIAGLVGMVSSDKNLVDIQLSNAVYDGSGEYHLNINNTTEVVIKGSTEAGATVNASSSELNITDQRVKLNSNNSFKYKVKIPANASVVTVRFDASKPGKNDSYIEVNILKPSDKSMSIKEPSTNTDVQSTPLTAADYIKSIIGSDIQGIKNVDVKNGNVTITYNSGDPYNEDEVIRQTSHDAIKVMQKLFPDNKITSVTIVRDIKFIDPYGKSYEDAGLTITIKKATANKIDWNGLDGRVYENSASLLNIADNYNINPSIYYKLTDPNLINLPISR